MGTEMHFLTTDLWRLEDVCTNIALYGVVNKIVPSKPMMRLGGGAKMDSCILDV